MIRAMVIEDYDEVRSLWMTIKGFGIRSVDDSREGVEAFLKRNPGMSVVAIEDGRVAGSILCGHDGRRSTPVSCLCGGRVQNARHRQSDGRILYERPERRAY